MTKATQNPPVPASPIKKLAFTCGTFTLVAGLILSLVAITAALLILLGVLP